MNLKDAGESLLAHRAGRRNDGSFKSALRVAEGDETLRHTLKAQAGFDERMVGVIQSIQPPAGLGARMQAMVAPVVGERSPLRFQLIQPAMLPVMVGLALLIGLGVWFILERQKNFVGREAVLRLLHTTKAMSGLELEQIQQPVPAWKLNDWFYMRGFESYAIPPELAELPAVGSRVFRQDGKLVAQVAADLNSSMINIFRASDFGVDLPEGAAWRVLEYEDWTAAIRQNGGTCTLVTFQGNSGEMRRFLEQIRVQP